MKYFICGDCFSAFENKVKRWRRNLQHVCLKHAIFHQILRIISKIIKLWLLFFEPVRARFFQAFLIMRLFPQKMDFKRIFVLVSRTHCIHVWFLKFGRASSHVLQSVSTCPYRAPRYCCVWFPQTIRKDHKSIKYGFTEFFHRKRWKAFTGYFKSQK